MKEIVILGRSISLRKCDKGYLKGITFGDSLTFDFYHGEYLGVDLLFVAPKEKNPSPRACALSANRWMLLFDKPVVFIFISALAYERQRLVEKGVYFVVSKKFAHLPMLVANERIRKTNPAQRLTPVAQYILLYHLQVESLEGRAAREMAGLLPYSYESITLGLTCLEDLGLCRKVPDGPKRKLILFTAKGVRLWEKAKKYASSPVEKRVYCDDMLDDGEYPICGINALSHYSMLNPDSERMVAVVNRKLKALLDENRLFCPNSYDGNVMIEGWKYPPVCKLGEVCKFVDKLSLVLSLQDDHDPRVEGEVERVLNEMTWED
ncbi:MAG: hypothetical protein HUK14_07810 [Muribaculaceae bacterium]|nr:hypothetical protein [Muribaculaceae bacterium]